MKNEYIQLISAVSVFIGATLALSYFHRRRKNQFLKQTRTYSNTPGFLEYQFRNKG
jgi:hypothetical protein